jgi:cytochrome c
VFPILKCTGLAIVALCLAGCGGAADSNSGPPVKPVAVADLPAPWNQGDLSRGGQIFLKCHNCHSLVAAEGDRQGPNLHGVFTRKPGSKPGYPYSAAVKGLALPQWTYSEVDKWVSNPQNYVDGTKMMFNGVADPIDRRDLIAYLAVNSTK